MRAFPVARAIRTALAAVVCLAAASGPRPAQAAPAPVLPTRPRTLHSLLIPVVRPEVSRLRPDWRGAAFLGVAGGATAIAAANDLPIERRITAHDSRTLRRVSRWIQPLGSEVVIGGGAAAWGLAWLANRDALFRSVQRADLAIATAGICTFALKEVVGRKRPDESPGDAAALDPFSGHDSFPSGHATLAFAAATTLDRETSSRWVPAIGYPLAGFVAWSRIHDRRHWPSDVVAGAAIGFGVAWKAEDALHPRAGGATARLELDAGDGALAAVRLRW